MASPDPVERPMSHRLGLTDMGLVSLDRPLSRVDLDRYPAGPTVTWSSIVSYRCLRERHILPN